MRKQHIARRREGENREEEKRGKVLGSNKPDGQINIEERESEQKERKTATTQRAKSNKTHIFSEQRQRKGMNFTTGWKRFLRISETGVCGCKVLADDTDAR